MGRKPRSPEDHARYMRAYYRANREKLASRQWARRTGLEVSQWIPREKSLKRWTTYRNYHRMVVSLLFQRDGDLCGICHKRIAIEDASIDHIVGVVDGGSDDATNIRLLHDKCNASRSRGSYATAVAAGFVRREESFSSVQF